MFVLKIILLFSLIGKTFAKKINGLITYKLAKKSQPENANISFKNQTLPNNY